MRRLLLVLGLLLLGAGASVAEEAADPVRVGLVRVRGDGPVTLRMDRLRALGIDDPYRVALRRAGRAVPVFSAQEVDVPAGHVAFPARNTEGPHSAHAVYEVLRLAQPRAAHPMPISPGVSLPRALAWARVHGALAAADRALYAPEEGQPPGWFLALLPRGQSVRMPLGPLGAEAQSPQVIEVEAYGAYDGLTVLRATWNGHDLGQAAHARAREAASRVRRVLRWEVPPGRVPAKAAPLVLHNASPPPEARPARDVSDHHGTLYVHRIRLVGRGSRIVPWARARVQEVERAGPPADPLAAAGRARHVILATPPLLKDARRLAAHRTAHGLPSAALPVIDVYDRYGFGAHHGGAIADFVRALRARRGVRLEHLVLAGDATYDRTDMRAAVTIPTPMARTIYNGATSADGLYAGGPDGPMIGRLPFDSAEEMGAYVDRLIRYETRPPADDAGRLLRFVTSEGRFGALIDGIIEARFRRVLARASLQPFDVAVTYAKADSPFLWPPHTFGQHVLDGLNEGALFFTYVGHGFERGFDTLRVGPARHRILHVRDVPQVAVRGTPPVMVVLACTTAQFDGVAGPGVGEALLRRPAGPIAYLGATRVCHPGYNALLGDAFARHMAIRRAAGGGPPRLADLLRAARAETRDPEAFRDVRMAVNLLAGSLSPDTRSKRARDARRAAGRTLADRLIDEGEWMYALLGDPATVVAFPQRSLEVKAYAGAKPGLVHVTVRGPLPAGTPIHVLLEHPRTRRARVPHKGIDAARAEDAARIRANHAAANDRLVAQTVVRATAEGRAVAELTLPEGVSAAGLIAKVRARTRGKAGPVQHVGAVALDD